ncbi:MAG: pyridoxamine 5'-phosphate oxidase family protein [Proteobacteria bacterium]|jgi:nitroimidazol reductase NimA-like FMN-containing flavoprotein (pyridoxamine 5'-phosphate oxidase superfamily)|nr:pyridoxamine 5'-phosphate oxidase family protein [Pseudomonadota bacterium]
MRKKEMEITDTAAIESIILKSSVCRLAMSENDRPYIVPLCFGYKDNALYFHSAREGKKVDMLRKNSKVCFELDTDNEIVSDESPCKWTMKYRSVIGNGKASLIHDPEAKRQAFDIIMHHYSDKVSAYSEAGLDNSLIIKIEIESMTGKQLGY